MAKVGPDCPGASSLLEADTRFRVNKTGEKATGVGSAGQQNIHRTNAVGKGPSRSRGEIKGHSPSPCLQRVNNPLAHSSHRAERLTSTSTQRLTSGRSAKCYKSNSVGRDWGGRAAVRSKKSLRGHGTRVGSSEPRERYSKVVPGPRAVTPMTFPGM